ncbi:CTP synthase ura7 [Vanrija albida]|uniref:CTP synthase ura7 n=1 Tax=Vanrija albida TaxID=181172 RepID=A0ABR3PS65_9TREE
MWDAQTALIAHQPSLAAKYYATAALPPYSSPTACLALGNLLVRGSSLAQPDPEPSPVQSRKSSIDEATTSPTTSWFTSLFRSTSPPPISPTSERPTMTRLVSQGWGIPTDGKRAVRDVEGSGKAGGWLVLGLGWVIESERHIGARPEPKVKNHDDTDDEDDVLVVDFKGKRRAPPPDTETLPPSSHSSTAADSFVIHTPHGDDDASPSKKIKLLYELLLPLLHLYRHGHIQRHDPVALPPITPSQLPWALKPHGDSQKGRNAWHLGRAVTEKLLELPLLKYSSGLSKETLMKRDAVLLMAHYIRGLTSSPLSAEQHFKAVIRQGPSGMEVADDLIRQAYRRLNIVLKTTGGTPISQAELDAYPFPLEGASPQIKHRRKKSETSIFSFADSTIHSSRMLLTPCKSSASLASLSREAPVIDHALDTPRALSSLRQVQRSHDRVVLSQARKSSSNGAWWPSLNQWSMSPPSANVSPPSPVSEASPVVRATESIKVPRPLDLSRAKEAGSSKPLRAVASSPQLGAHRMASPPSMRRLPFEPEQQVASIDPELAALELASALTKHVTCSVCNASGVNFPNCRKCGLTFCSRKCRIDEKGAGNGKRHICGAWESRRLLTVPESPSHPRHDMSSEQAAPSVSVH